jgi:hypothetical protein
MNVPSYLLFLGEIRLDLAYIFGFQGSVGLKRLRVFKNLGYPPTGCDILFGLFLMISESHDGGVFFIYFDFSSSLGTLANRADQPHFDITKLDDRSSEHLS